nr:hypothetical protein [Tanacetum cinerariifolium]
MNYPKEQTDSENAPPTLKDLKFWTTKEKKTRKIDRLARSLLIQWILNDIYSLIDSNETTKDLWDAFERQMRGSEYGEQDRKAAILYKYETFKAIKREQLLDTYLRYLQVINDLKKCGYKKENYELSYKLLYNLQPEWKQYGTLMRQTKNLMDINIDALYNILKQNQGDVNDALGYKKKAIVVTSDPLALVAKKTKVSKQKEKVFASSDSEGSGADDFTDEKKSDMSKVKRYNCKKEGHFAKDCKKAKKAIVVTSDPLALVAKKTKVSKQKEKVFASSDSEGSGADDFSELKKINALLEKAFNRRKFYTKPTNNNLRTSSTSQSANKKQECVKSDDKKVKKKADEKKSDMSKVKRYNCKKEGHFAKDCKKAKEINVNMVFMAQIEKVLSDSDESSSSTEETIVEVAYYTSESKSESEYETLEFYDNSTNYGLSVNDNDDQEIFHDAIESASENFIENHIDS